MRKRTFLLLVLIIVAALAGSAWQIAAEYKRVMFSPSAMARPTMFEVKPGMTAGQVAAGLRDARLIENARWVTLYLRIEGLEGHLQAGVYHFPEHAVPARVVDAIAQGNTYEVSVTIPEGLARIEIGPRLQAAGFGTSEAFMALTEDPELIARLTGGTYPNLEGFLFPDTYRFSPGAELETIITAMVRRGLRVRDELVAGGVTASDYSHYARLKLASIVEREAKLDDERARIASVFYNRLRLQRRLESCATVQYALGMHKAQLTYQDLKYPSPYNTYLHAGLPPTPICNPGRASLAAVYRPARTEYLYFVARGDGSHEFSSSLREHISNRNKYR